jgi:RNA polymerase sigma-70 factor (ECF subfamily)
LRCVPVFVSSRNARLGGPLGQNDLDDLVQDVVINVWRKIDRYRGEAPLEGWIYQFCLLEMKTFMRRKRNSESRSQNLDAYASEMAAENAPADDYYEDVYSGLDRLDREYAEVIRLKHFSHMTFEEIAQELKISANTVKTRYYRGLVKLKKHLDPRRREGHE